MRNRKRARRAAWIHIEASALLFDTALVRVAADEDVHIELSRQLLEHLQKDAHAETEDTAASGRTHGFVSPWNDLVTMYESNAKLAHSDHFRVWVLQ